MGGWSNTVRGGIERTSFCQDSPARFYVVRKFGECVRCSGSCALNPACCAGSVIDELGIMRLKEANPGKGSKPGDESLEYPGGVLPEEPGGYPDRSNVEKPPKNYLIM